MSLRFPVSHGAKATNLRKALTAVEKFVKTFHKSIDLSSCLVGLEALYVVYIDTYTLGLSRKHHDALLSDLRMAVMDILIAENVVGEDADDGDNFIRVTRFDPLDESFDSRLGS